MIDSTHGNGCPQGTGWQLIFLILTQAPSLKDEITVEIVNKYRMLIWNSLKYRKMLGADFNTLRGHQACLGLFIVGIGWIELPRRKFSRSNFGQQKAINELEMRLYPKNPTTSKKSHDAYVNGSSPFNAAHKGTLAAPTEQRMIVR